MPVSSVPLTVLRRIRSKTVRLPALAAVAALGFWAGMTVPAHAGPAQPATAAMQSASVQSPSVQQERPGSFPHMRHVFVIMMENHGSDQILDPANTYTKDIQDLAHTYGLASDYYGITHDSMPNYVGLLEGNTWNANQDDTAGESQYFNHTNLVDELQGAHVSWKAYIQSLPQPGYTGPSNAYSGKGGMYDREHNPFAYIPDIADNPSRTKNMVPLTQLGTDLADNQVPDFAWITPNVCDDMHGGATECPSASGTGYSPQLDTLYTDGDTFLKTWVARIMSSKAWTGNSTIVITWDENEYTTLSGCCDSPLQPEPPVSFVKNSAGTYNTNGGDLSGAQLLGGGLVPTIVISREGPRHYVDSQPYNHYSLLQTIERNWNLPFLGNASDVLNVHPLTPLITPRRSRDPR